MLNVVTLTTGPLFTLEEAKTHLNVETDSDDQLIETYSDAAVQACLDFCDRKLVPEGAEPVFKAAALILLGDLYANRVPLSPDEVPELPGSVQSLLKRRRIIRI